MSRTLADRPIRTTDAAIHDAFRLAGERYAAIGVDVEEALRRLGQTSISLHCWQGDDVRGFEPGVRELGGGLAVSGHYPGKPRTVAELRSDLEIALASSPAASGSICTPATPKRTASASIATSSPRTISSAGSNGPRILSPRSISIRPSSRTA